MAKLWDLMYLSSLADGRAGAVIYAISGLDMASWDIIGNATGRPVCKLVGGETLDSPGGGGRGWRAV